MEEEIHSQSEDDETEEAKDSKEQSETHPNIPNKTTMYLSGGSGFLFFLVLFVQCA